MAGVGVILTSVIFFATEKEERHHDSKQTFIVTTFDFMSNYTNFELLHAMSFLQDNLFVADHIKSFVKFYVH